MSWQPGETAPKDMNPFLADVGYPWAVLAVWNEYEGHFVTVELQANMVNGEYTDTYFENEREEVVKRWMPLPAVK